jgi:MoxR-like ATPase
MDEQTNTSTNAAHAAARKEVAVDHRFLGVALGWLSAAREEGAIASMLDDLMDYVAGHFAAEERPDGFFDSVIQHAPQHASRIAELRAEHVAMTAQLEKLRAKIEPPYGPASDELVASIAELVQALRTHERREGSLLQEVYERDLGIGA